MKNEFYYSSKNEVTQIHAIEWIPSSTIKAVLQICHGMTEYVDRYDEFAEYMNAKGYYVVGNDHLGHGKSVRSENEYGFFGKKYGNQFVVADIHCLRKRTEEAYPGLPYFILGHSMGSFLTRQYIQTHGQGLRGAIVMGTGYKPPIVLAGGKLLCKIIGMLRGSNYRSKLIDSMAFGGYNKRFLPERTASDWLTKDTEIVDRYVNDPCCTFVFTVNAYYHMFCGMQKAGKQQNIRQIPKELPLLFTAGQDDPVGDFGKGVERVYRIYKGCGIKDVALKLYEGDRHEILNELDRQQVYEDLFIWMEVRRVDD